MKSIRSVDNRVVSRLDNRVGRTPYRRARRRAHSSGSIIMAIIAVFILVFASGYMVVNASNSKEEAPKYKYFTTIQVSADDTLWDIATEYATEEPVKQYINNICNLNNLTSNTVYSGQYLTVYYYSEEFK